MNQPVRVLLVEDNEADAYLTTEALDSSKIHISITVVADGVDAVEFMRKALLETPHDLPDLVLLDLNLPRMDGCAVLKIFKDDEALRKIPVVVLTSSDADLNIAKSYAAGANCYVTKPVSLESFQSIVRSIEGLWSTSVKRP